MGGFSNLSGVTQGNSPQQANAFQSGLYDRTRTPSKVQFQGDILSTEGVKSLNKGSNLLQQPIDYYSKILSGDRQSAMEAQAPEISSIVSGYKAARKGASEFTPRGGGRIEQQQNQSFQEAGTITSLLQKARPEAAQAITKISENLQSLGISEESLGQQAYLAVMNNSLQQRGQNMALIGNLAQGVGEAAGAYFGAQAGG